jgi:hypothetical protein
LRKAGIVRERLIGVGVAFPDDISRAHLPDQPADYAAWASVKIDDLIRVQRWAIALARKLPCTSTAAMGDLCIGLDLLRQARRVLAYQRPERPRKTKAAKGVGHG